MIPYLAWSFPLLFFVFLGAVVVERSIRRKARDALQPMEVVIGTAMGTATLESLREADELGPNAPPVTPDAPPGIGGAPLDLVTRLATAQIWCPQQPAMANVNQSTNASQAGLVNAAGGHQEGLANAAGGPCKPWCGLPFGDKRGPSEAGEGVFFATQLWGLGSPAYCCPQTSDPRAMDHGQEAEIPPATTINVVSTTTINVVSNHQRGGITAGRLHGGLVTVQAQVNQRSHSHVDDVLLGEMEKLMKRHGRPPARKVGRS